MEELKVLLKESILLIEKTTEFLYQQKKLEGYKSLDDTLKSLIKLVNTILRLKGEKKEISIDEIEFLSQVKETMNALEKKDEVMVCDILEYEIKEMLIETMGTMA